MKKITVKDLQGWGWEYFGTSGVSSNISGWKFHVFGNNIEDSAYLANALMPLLMKYGMAMKVATPSVFEAGIGIEGDVQYGKCVTMYIPSSIFKAKLQDVLIKDIQDALKDYPKTGAIHGDRSIDGKLHYRYELGTPINPEVGVSHRQYEYLYESNRGEYNIENNKDPFGLHG